MQQKKSKQFRNKKQGQENQGKGVCCLKGFWDDEARPMKMMNTCKQSEIPSVLLGIP